MPSKIADPAYATRVEAAIGCRIQTDHHTVWVNARAGWCIARFTRYGIDVHNEITPEEGYQGCLLCRGNMDGLTLQDWEDFKQAMMTFYAVTVPDRYMPDFLRQPVA